MKNWIEYNGIPVLLFVFIFIVGMVSGGVMSYKYVKTQIEPVPIENTAKIDSLVNVISQKEGQIIQLKRDYSGLERLKTKTRVKYRDRIIKVREGDVTVVFEELRDNL